MPRPRFIWTDEKLDEVADALDKWVDEGIKNKSHFLIGDFCFENEFGFRIDYFSRYCECSVKLYEAYTRARQWQAHCISKGVLFNKLNGRFGQFILLAFHKDLGYQLENSITINANGELLDEIEPSKELVGKQSNESRYNPREIEAEATADSK